MVDVIIPVKKQGRHEDLRYALRSLAQNFIYDRIYIAGFKPRWVTNVEYVERDQSKHSYRANAFLNIQKTVNCKDIGELIVVGADDLVFLKPTFVIPLEHGLYIRQQRWAQEWPQTVELLKKYGVLRRYSWEHHGPALVEKDKLKFILTLIRREYPNDFDKIQWRSVYYNYYGVEGVQGFDCKIYGEPDPSPAQQFLSTEDHTFKHAKPFLKRLFSEKSIYEK